MPILFIYTTTTTSFTRAADATKPRHAPKTARGLHTDAEIQQARENVAKFPAATKLADDIIKNADEWMEWSGASPDEPLTRLRASAWWTSPLSTVVPAGLRRR